MISLLGSEKLKTYPLQYMTEIIDFISDKYNVNILFNYFPKQLKEAKIVFNSCKKSTQQNIYFDLLGSNLREYIAIMDNCDIIIGNDGGAINLAKALNKPSFIIFSPWIEKKIWSTFEDGKKHLSIHLNDITPDLISNKQLVAPANITKNTEEINTNDNQVQKLTNTEEIKDFNEYTEECLKRIIKLKVPSNDEIKDLLFDLPFENELINKKLAIFDLDETLIHCEARKPSKAQKQIMCNLPNGGQAKVKNNNKIKKKFLIYFFDIYIYRLALTLDLIGKNACKKFPKIT